MASQNLSVAVVWRSPGSLCRIALGVNKAWDTLITHHCGAVTYPVNMQILAKTSSTG